MREATDWNNYNTNPNSKLLQTIFFKPIANSYLKLLKRADFSNNISILEFGCGTGYITKRIVEKYPTDCVTLIDSNRRMLDIANTTLSKVNCKKELIQEDFFNFDPNKAYDLVHSQGVIEHFEQEKRLDLLKKHRDATKLNGYCILYSPTPTKSYRIFRKILELFRSWKFIDEVPLKEEIIVKEMEALGFTKIKTTYFWKYFLTEVGIIFKRVK